MTAVWLALAGLGLLLARAGLRERRTGARGRAARDACAVAALALLAGSLGTAGPLPEEGAPAAGLRVVLAVDVSPSMGAADPPPSRLDRARAEIRQLLAGLPGARFALLPFAAEPVLQVPFTGDREALGFFLAALGPDTLPARGSAPAEAVAAAQELAAQEEGPALIVLFSDGERTRPGPGPPLRPGPPLVVVPLGSEEGGAVPGEGGRPRRDAAGRPLLTRADRAGLARLAAAAGGEVLEVPPGGWAAAEILRRFAPTRPPGQRTGAAPLCAAAALVLLLLRLRPPAVNAVNAATVGGVLLLALAGLAACTEQRTDPGGERFAAAAAAWRDGRLLEAAETYGQAAGHLAGKERAAALYNRGTALLAASRPAAAVASLEQALLLAPGDPATCRNLALALRAAGPTAAPGDAPGEGQEENEAGAALEPRQAARLLESVRPVAGAPPAPGGAAPVRVPERDW